MVAVAGSGMVEGEEIEENGIVGQLLEVIMSYFNSIKGVYIKMKNQ